MKSNRRFGRLMGIALISLAGSVGLASVPTSGLGGAVAHARQDPPPRVSDTITFTGDATLNHPITKGSKNGTHAFVLKWGQGTTVCTWTSDTEAGEAAEVYACDISITGEVRKVTGALDSGTITGELCMKSADDNGTKVCSAFNYDLAALPAPWGVTPDVPANGKHAGDTVGFTISGTVRLMEATGSN
jgi:hypothetical protein